MVTVIGDNWCAFYTHTTHIFTILYITITTNTDIHYIKPRGRLRMVRIKQSLYYIQFIRTFSTIRKRGDGSFNLVLATTFYVSLCFHVPLSESLEKAFYTQRHRCRSHVRGSESKSPSLHEPIFFQGSCCAALSQNWHLKEFLSEWIRSLLT